MIRKIKKLINILNKANKSYYQEDKEIMSDFEYDKLYDELKSLEEKTGIIMSNSPTQNVGFTVISKLNKVKHDSKILSLDKTKEIDKLKDFLADNDGILSFKMDGLTVVLKYNDGQLEQAVTRGNGQIGEDITHNVKFFKNIPLRINLKEELVLRGEAIISLEDFKLINLNLEDSERYKNPRNLCSGTVRQLNNENIKDRNVKFLTFSVISNNFNFKLKSEQLDFVKDLGFDVVYNKIVNKNNIHYYVKKFEKMVQKSEYATDGLVLTFNDIQYSKNLGETSKFFKDSIAFKWKDSEEETTLLNVEWNTSRTGLINPIAIFEPIELEGTTVTRASLHNLSIIKNLKLGIGDKIKVYKANMIIPQISENLTKSNNLEIPKKCSVCHEEAKIIKLRDGEALKCFNPNCEARIVNQITHFVSRDAMNIEGFSKSTIEKFILNGFIKDFTDIYNIKKYEKEIIELDGFGEKSYQNLLDSINKSKKVKLENFIYSLGIENVGLINAKILVKRFNNNFESIKNATFDELLEIEGFGNVISENIYKYFNNDDNLKLIDKIFCKLQIINVEENNKLSDYTFVITGNLEKFKNRNELKQRIESFGGQISSNVSKNTSYLINNNINSSSSKNKKAIELGVKIITEDEFLELIK